VKPKDRIIVPLDRDTPEEAQALIRELAGEVGYFKIGLQFLMADGAARLTRVIREAGAKVFIDPKLNDIPNTMAQATRVLDEIGADLITVHSNSGRPGLRAAVEARGNAMILAVTVLTSLDDNDTHEIYGRPAAEMVRNMARMAVECGAGGLVCSPQEVRVVRRDHALDKLMLVIPGIRPQWAELGDQKRAATPREAVAAGADLLVVGRPVTSPPAAVGSVVKAARLVAEEIEGGLKERKP
jgi:orotidine-5'-phosphate decarboxylase